MGSVVVSFKDFGRVGPKGLHADIGSLKRFRFNRHLVAKKLLLLSGPVGTSSDIASKRGFFAIFECNGELKRFLRCRSRGILEKNLQNLDWI
jgi:hypothetical protein